MKAAPMIVAALILCTAIQSRAGAYHKAGYGQHCSDSSTRITDRYTCQEAARELGLDWGHSWWGPWDFPGCLHTKDRRNKVYFNLSPHASNDLSSHPKMANYAEICIGEEAAGCISNLCKNFGECNKNGVGTCTGCYDLPNGQKQCEERHEDKGEINYCYSHGRNSSDIQCKPGYKSSFGGFCCLRTRSTFEDVINSLVPSDFYCHSIENSNITECPSGFEHCHHKYCCPKTCPPTEADAAYSLMTSEFSISCSTCDDYCDKGAAYIKDYLCRLLPWSLSTSCTFLVKHFSKSTCNAFCGKICTKMAQTTADPGSTSVLGVPNGCFATTSKVETISGIKNISELVIGDFLKTYSGGLSPHFTEFIGWLDREEHSPTKMLQISTSQALSPLTLSGSHIIFTSNTTKYADELQPGDCLMYWNGTHIVEHNVTEIENTLEFGWWAPLTRAGTLLVDGYLASCYASFPHKLAEVAMIPVKALPTVLLDNEESQHEDGVRSVVKKIKKIGEAIGVRKIKSKVDDDLFSPKDRVFPRQAFANKLEL